MMDKKTTKTLVMVVLVCAIILAGYAYVRDRSAKKTQSEKLTKADELILYDLKNEYPHGARDVVNLYSRMLTCIYTERPEKKQLTQLVAQMRKLYAIELCNDPDNTEEAQVQALQKEIQNSGEEQNKITNYVVEESSQVEYETINDRQVAQVDATYTIRNGNEYPKSTQTYLLVMEGEQWKILGWQNSSESSKEKE